MPVTPRVLLVDADHDRTAAVRDRLVASGFKPTVRSWHECSEIAATDVAVLVMPAAALADSAARELEAVVGRLAAKNVASVVWGGSPQRGPHAPLLDCLATDVPLDEVMGRLHAIAHYAPMLKRMDRELRHLQTLGTQLNRYFEEIDQEMRLAGRLQHDFLPAELPDLSPFRVSTIYRPATWVSGDTYDVFPIDEHQAGIFLADAMGHGVAAGLITMFMQQTLRMRELYGEAKLICHPPTVLTRMHDCLVRQRLPSCQFVTAVYFVLDRVACTAQLSRAGHPFPLLVRPDGAIEEIEADGGLLGLPDIDAEFDMATVPIAPGEKLILYTDGLEDVFLTPAPPDGDAPTGMERFSTMLREWVRFDAAALTQAIESHLDQREGSLNPADDITVVVIERVAGAPTAIGSC